MKKLMILLFCFLSSLGLVYGETSLDPANPPTDDMDYEEIQQKIAAMLPDRADLLKFKSLFTFKFAAWPQGLNQGGATFQQAFKGYSLKTDGSKVYLLDKAGRTLFAYDAHQAKQSMVATDQPKGSLQFDDFAMMRSGGMVIADNSRNALLYFVNNRLVKKIGFDGERDFFRHCDFVESDKLGISMAVYDSGRDKTYVFGSDGLLQWETTGRAEPCFLGNSLIRLEKHDSELEVQRFSQVNKVATTFSTYRCDPGNIILDAWAAGTFAGQLAVVVYEGRGDEDHPDYARLLLIKDKTIQVHKFRPGFDMRLSLLTPYRLLLTRSGLSLLTARLSDAGLEVVAAELPLK